MFMLLIPSGSVLSFCHWTLPLSLPKQPLFYRKNRMPEPDQILDEPMSLSTLIHCVSTEKEKVVQGNLYYRCDVTSWLMKRYSTRKAFSKRISNGLPSSWLCSATLHSHFCPKPEKKSRRHKGMLRNKADVKYPNDSTRSHRI